ncbi:type II toxin-antitoxin system RatA family toxin [Nocardia yunnanensis]|nr:SRPBCC family protein [Nocardia yunnanensis]
MPEYQLHATVSGRTPEAVFALIEDFGRYPEVVPNVIESLSVTVADDGARYSEWAVRFHGGILKWRERDDVSIAADRIEFRQIVGDFAELAGSWRVGTTPEGEVRVSIVASFDLGMPDVATILDPIALAAFDETMRTLLTTLLGPALRFDSVATTAGSRS